MTASPGRDEPGRAAAALATLLADAHLAAPYELPALAKRAVLPLGGKDAVCYLVDLQQTVLIPFVHPDDTEGSALEQLTIDTTLAGRAYQHLQVLTQNRGAAESIVWLPLLDGTERLGVMAVTVDGDGEAFRDGPASNQLRHFASLLAEVIMSKTMYGDTIVRLRRATTMGLAAELQWSLLPPLTFACRRVTVAAVLEPAYEVAGDTFDYAVDLGMARVAVFDAMGHGLRSAQLAAMAITAYRHARRAGRSLIDTCSHIDEALLASYAGASFTTAVLAELDTMTGELRWINAGHPEPLLLRHGKLVKTLHAAPRPPLGVDLRGTTVPTTPAVGTEQLEPGDCVLLYTDGVTESRSPNGEFYGEQRLADLVVRNLAAGLPAPETMRRVVHALLEHQQGQLTDDASLALVQWPTDSPAILPT